MLNPRTHSSEHPDSYYAATRRYNRTYPSLQATVEAEVCVIGGGFSGVNTALELAERGFKVVLLEAFRIGWGASGRNGGQLIRGLGHGAEQFHNELGSTGVQAINQMGLEAVDLVKQRIGRYAIQCDLKMGYCDLAHKPRHMAEFEREKSWLDSVGYAHETRIIGPDQLHTVVGSDNYIGGLIDMGSGHVHPLNLTLGEAEAAATLGVQIFEQSKVIDITYGDQNTLHTATGQVKADRLVICGNAYVAGLNSRLESQVLPAGSYLIATEPLTDAQWQQVLPQDMAVCDQRVALDYYRLSADRRLLFGGLCNYSGRDPASIVATLKPHMDKVFPYLKGVKIDFQWGGMIGIGANRMPQIGRLRPNVYYAQAYAGHGINATHLAAHVIAEHIAEESERITIFEKINHLRFPGGRQFRAPLLAAGMLYHRAKDLF
ncbi:FAD-binding oxidoreductase [Reinekea sp.]|jgi:glycine/D-amino acid oxidase-like deaminating enzyme|uniref:NAD(P)/FAD-dependent oxidoreductase n=1 Tax=Reinekea sp. TaxID=1970455 RepID=UPI002A7F200C|nr:FAD-binding oxidoreductase [Reinekea sp.]